MGRLARAGIIIAVSLVLQPAMLILGFNAVFPDFFHSPYPYVVLLLAISILAGTKINRGLDIFATAILASGLYVLLFRLFLSSFIVPYLYNGYEAYSLASSIFLPGFFYFFAFLFVEVLSLFIGSRIAAYLT
ncbi:MAG: hypothetical protein ACP5UO_03050 [Thermoplasmata archaeon]